MPKTNVSKCTVGPFCDNVLQNASDLAAALKRLRRSMRQCTNCVGESDCPILSSFNQKFQTALQQITDEWQLT
jgi:hypothetical protein